MDLVTGSTGFIGKVLARRLLLQGRRVRGIVRDPIKARPLQDAGMEVIQGDLNDPGTMPRVLEGVERVYHLAGTTKALSGRAYWQGNVQATLMLVQAFANRGVGRLIMVSSLAAAGPSVPGEPRTEQMAPCPVSLYGRSKLRAEEIVRNLPDKLSWCVVRPPIVYGPGDRDFFTLFKAATRGRVPMADPAQLCSLVHVQDLVEALVLCGSRPEAHRRVFHVGTAPDLTAAELAEAAGKAVGRVCRPLVVPSWLVRGACNLVWLWSLVRGRPAILSPDKALEMAQPAWHCTTEGIRETLGWRPEISHEDGFSQAVNWYRNEGLL